MPKFRKKPVVIEAVQFGSRLDAEWICDIPEWLFAAMEVGAVQPGAPPEDHLIIKTLEGNMRADPGDWIIKGVKGEIYPCKPDIFEETYQPVGIDMPTLTPEMEESLRQAMEEPGNIQYMRDPGPAVGGLERGKGWLERTMIAEVDLDDAPEAYAGGMDPSERYNRFRDALEGAVNCHSMENGSDTPDFMLAAFMVDVLTAFDNLMRKRDGWYGGSHQRLKAQLEAEGAHTEALQAELEEERRCCRENAEEIGRLKRMMDSYITSEPDKGD
jgi:hypothetical protein